MINTLLNIYLRPPFGLPLRPFLRSFISVIVTHSHFNLLSFFSPSITLIFIVLLVISDVSRAQAFFLAGQFDILNQIY